MKIFGYVLLAAFITSAVTSLYKLAYDNGYRAHADLQAEANAEASALIERNIDNANVDTSDAVAVYCQLWRLAPAGTPIREGIDCGNL